MKQYKGKGIEKGIAMGPVFFYEKKEQKQRRPAADSVAELLRFADAKNKARKQLKDLHDHAQRELGLESAAIFEAQQTMLDDEDFNAYVSGVINSEKLSVESAVAAAGEHFAGRFSRMEDPYLKARSTDVKDVSGLLLRILGGGQEEDGPKEPVILVAEELTPSETMRFDRSKLLGIVTYLGSADSHAAILARTMKLPAISGIEIDKKWNGLKAIVDGHSGMLTIDPDKTLTEEMEKQRLADEALEKEMQLLKDRETLTKGGRRIQICANIGGVEDVAEALENGAEGIGLFRSEFLYLKSDGFPSEEEQFAVYKDVLQRMEGKRVVIRTLDLGADKQAAYFRIGREENPAMGYRGIRICLDQPDIFRTQLRAILRASAFGNPVIMFPMIVSMEEFRQCKQHVEEIKAELKEAGIPYKEDVELGVVIETPAAALISGELAKEADYFSVGTNDLTQYTLAADRGNVKLDHVYDPHHPAVLSLIRMTVENGHAAGIPVGVCGELAADTELTRAFLEYGVDELSVIPAYILPLRNEVIHLD